MFCPRCGDEYREGFTRCHDCEVALVAALPAEAPPPVILAHFGHNPWLEFSTSGV